MRALRCTWLGRVGYRVAWERQEEIRRAVLGGDEDAEELLLLEHDPVVTLGRSARATNVRLSHDALRARGVDVVDTSRGGDVTYHGPGQLVVYPVVRLTRGVVHHVSAVGQAISDVLCELGLKSEWRRDPAGVWMSEGGGKIAACGIHISRRVAIHGFAVNVTDESLDGFRWIVPCGLAGVRTTSVAAEGWDPPPPLPELAERIALSVCRRLGRTPIYSCDPSANR